MIYVFTGNGKGKTTSSLGILLRAAGHGMRACLIQFMKEIETGEIAPLRALGVECVTDGAGFYKIRGDHSTEETHKMKARKALGIAREKILSGNYDIIVLDEINVAVTTGLLDEKDVMELIEAANHRSAKPTNLQTYKPIHLILTGRGATPALITRADLVSEINEIKHPFQKGILAKKGLEF